MHRIERAIRLIKADHNSSVKIERCLRFVLDNLSFSHKVLVVTFCSFVVLNTGIAGDAFHSTKNSDLNCC